MLSFNLKLDISTHFQKFLLLGCQHETDEGKAEAVVQEENEQTANRPGNEHNIDSSDLLIEDVRAGWTTVIIIRWL